MIFSAGEVAGALVRALVVVTLGLVSIHAFGLFVSSINRGPVLALAGSLSALLLWDVFKSDVGELRWFVFASHAPTFADGSGMREMSKFARGMSDAGYPEAVHSMGLVFPLAESIVFLVLACLVIRRRPICSVQGRPGAALRGISRGPPCKGPLRVWSETRGSAGTLEASPPRWGR